MSLLLEINSASSSRRAAGLPTSIVAGAREKQKGKQGARRHNQGGIQSKYFPDLVVPGQRLAKGFKDEHEVNQKYGLCPRNQTKQEQITAMKKARVNSPLSLVEKMSLVIGHNRSPLNPGRKSKTKVDKTGTPLPQPAYKGRAAASLGLSAKGRRLREIVNSVKGAETLAKQVEILSEGSFTMQHKNSRKKYSINKGPKRIIVPGSKEEKKLLRQAYIAPFMTNTGKAEKWNKKHPNYTISAATYGRTVKSRLIEQGKNPFTRQKGQLISMNSNDERLADVQLGMAETLQHIPEEAFLYIDEYPGKEGGNMENMLGLFPRGQGGTAPGFYTAGKTWTIINIVFITGALSDPDTKGILLKQWITDGGAKDDDTYTFFAETQTPPTFAPNLGGPPIHVLLDRLIDSGDITEYPKFVLSDMLGRSGTSQSPEKLHFHPGIFRYCAAHGIRYVLLAPLAHMFNCIELCQGTFQRWMRRWRCPRHLRKKLKWSKMAALYKARVNYMMTGPRTFGQAQRALSDMMANGMAPGANGHHPHGWISSAIKRGMHERGGCRYFFKNFLERGNLRPWVKNWNQRLEWIAFESGETNTAPEGERPRKYEFVEITAHEQKTAELAIANGDALDFEVGGQMAFAVDVDVNETGDHRAQRLIARAERLEDAADELERKQHRRTRKQTKRGTRAFISSEDFKAKKKIVSDAAREKATTARAAATLACTVADPNATQPRKRKRKTTKKSRKEREQERVYVATKWQVGDVVAVRWEGEYGTILYCVSNVPGSHADVSSKDLIGLNTYKKNKKRDHCYKLATTTKRIAGSRKRTKQELVGENVQANLLMSVERVKTRQEALEGNGFFLERARASPKTKTVVVEIDLVKFMQKRPVSNSSDDEEDDSDDAGNDGSDDSEDDIDDIGEAGVAGEFIAQTSDEESDEESQEEESEEEESEEEESEEDESEEDESEEDDEDDESESEESESEESKSEESESEKSESEKSESESEEKDSSRNGTKKKVRSRLRERSVKTAAKSRSTRQTSTSTRQKGATSRSKKRRRNAGGTGGDNTSGGNSMRGGKVWGGEGEVGEEEEVVVVERPQRKQRKVQNDQFKSLTESLGLDQQRVPGKGHCMYLAFSRSYNATREDGERVCPSSQDDIRRLTVHLAEEKLVPLRSELERLEYRKEMEELGRRSWVLRAIPRRKRDVKKMEGVIKRATSGIGQATTKKKSWGREEGLTLLADHFNRNVMILRASFEFGQSHKTWHWYCISPLFGEQHAG